MEGDDSTVGYVKKAKLIKQKRNQNDMTLFLYLEDGKTVI